jgi:hypothetical protein
MLVRVTGFLLNRTGNTWAFLTLVLQQCEKLKKTISNQMAVITAVTLVIHPDN